MEILKRHPSDLSLLEAYSPAKAEFHASAPERCIFGSSPTLLEARSIYGVKIDEAFLVKHLVYLNEICGIRYKMDAPMMQATAHTIASEYFYLKFSEWQLFFYRFRLGYYEQFYGNIDPMVIIRSIRSFIKERNLAYDSYENLLRNKEREQWKQRACTREEAQQWRERICDIILSLKTWKSHDTEL